MIANQATTCIGFTKGIVKQSKHYKAPKQS
jgi:hypothetical protein